MGKRLFLLTAAGALAGCSQPPVYEATEKLAIDVRAACMDQRSLGELISAYTQDKSHHDPGEETCRMADTLDRIAKEQRAEK